MQALDLKKVAQGVKEQHGYIVMVIGINGDGQDFLGLPFPSAVMADIDDLQACRRMLENAIATIDKELAPHLLFNQAKKGK